MYHHMEKYMLGSAPNGCEALQMAFLKLSCHGKDLEPTTAHKYSERGLKISTKPANPRRRHIVTPRSIQVITTGSIVPSSANTSRSTASTR